MEIGKTLYVHQRDDWRDWLQANHDREPEIWLVFYRKGSGKPSLPYDDAVEEALCFGWIDSIVKKLDDHARAQRFSPRKPKSEWSETNLERIRRLKEQGKMAPAGLAAVGDRLDGRFQVPPDILRELKRDAEVWRNFQRFPESYQRVRIGWIDMSRKRPEVYKQRLDYFLRMTKRNKRFGSVR